MAADNLCSRSHSMHGNLSPMSQTCIERLRSHRPEDVDLYRPHFRSASLFAHKALHSSRQSRLAAVLVLLYEKANELRVLLTTRSKSLRAHPGETALPGGKVDEEDANIIATAYREAHEEVGLPFNCPAVHTVGILRPFLSNRKIVVRPVVALLTDVSVLDRLKASEDEVEHIFNHPLEALLEPEIVRKEPLVEKGSVDWPYEEELHNSDDRRLTFLGDASYRMHRFRSSASPVKGLTAEILMTTAEIAYAKPTAFERYAPEQPKDFGGISALLAAAERGSPKRVSLSGTCTPIGIAPRVSLYGNP